MTRDPWLDNAKMALVTLVPYLIFECLLALFRVHVRRPLASWLQHLVDPFGLAEREVRKAVDVTVAQEAVGVGQHFDEEAPANLPAMAGTRKTTQ